MGQDGLMLFPASKTAPTQFKFLATRLIKRMKHTKPNNAALGSISLFRNCVILLLGLCYGKTKKKSNQVITIKRSSEAVERNFEPLYDPKRKQKLLYRAAVLLKQIHSLVTSENMSLKVVPYFIV